MIHRIYIGIGSNVNREKNILAAISNLKDVFSELAISNVYESTPIGVEDTTNYFNLVGAYETNLSPRQVNKQLKIFEKKAGQRRKKNCPLDLDLLLYDNFIDHDNGLDIPRKDIIEFAYVAIPLAEINGDQIHPETGKSFTEHSKISDQKVWLSDLDIMRGE